MIEIDEEVTEHEAAEFEASMALMATARPSRAKRKAAERDAQKTKAERSRQNQSGQVRSAAINVRVTPAFKATVDKGAKDLGMTATQLIEEAIAAFIKSKVKSQG